MTSIIGKHCCSCLVIIHVLEKIIKALCACGKKCNIVCVFLLTIKNSNNFHLNFIFLMKYESTLPLYLHIMFSILTFKSI